MIATASWCAMHAALRARTACGDGAGVMGFSSDELTAIGLSLRVALWATLASLPAGVLVALALARGEAAPPEDMSSGSRAEDDLRQTPGRPDGDGLPRGRPHFTSPSRGEDGSPWV